MLETNKEELKIKIKNISWETPIRKIFSIPSYWLINVDIQTISDDALEKIFNEKKLLEKNIPSKEEIIPIEDQSNYYKKIKNEVINRLMSKKFAIIQWPTWTWKTTLIKTISYENWLEIYEVWADIEKTVDDFAKKIQTIKKWNVLQIKEVPGLLLKALTNWWIFLINEANTLNPDIQLALANMLESWFVIIWTKKYIVHPNFSLVFTSNKEYSWTNDYNQAVIRKSWWIVELDYEPESSWEEKIVLFLYNKIKKELNVIKKSISDTDLLVIAKLVRKFRNDLRSFNKSNSNKLLSQDLNEIRHFLYIRFYEKLLKDILIDDNININLENKVQKIFLPYVQDKIVWFWVDWTYINHKNDIEQLNKLLNKVFSWVVFSLVEESSWKILLDNDLLDWIINDIRNLNAEYLFDLNNKKEEEKKQQIREKQWFTRIWINKNVFKKVLENEVKSSWEKLKRIEKIEKIAQDMYEKLVETKRTKIINKINYKHDDNLWDILIVNINWEDFIFKNKDQSINKIKFSEIKNEKDFIDKIFWNGNIEIIYKNETFENIFDVPKSLFIRRFSKQVEIKKDYIDYVIFLWFSWEIRDIRYVWEETNNFYIPQSKANDLILSVYTYLKKEDLDKINRWHYLIINWNGNLEFRNILDIKNRIKLWEKIKVLKKVDDNWIISDIKQRFSNLNKLNLHNWAEEKYETWIPSPIYWEAYPIQSSIEQKLVENFEATWYTSEKVIEEIYKTILSWEDVLLIWPSWVWKSSYAREIAKKLNLPYIDLQITEWLEETDIQSKLNWNEWELEEIFTPFLDYYVNWWVVELKELNMAYVLTFLNNFLDKNWEIRIQDKIYKRHPNFVIIATWNPVDNRLFFWTKPLNLAVQARFRQINLDYLEINEEKEILLKIAKKFNNKLYENEEFEVILNDLLKIVVFPIRKKINELRLSSSDSTSEQLKILASKNITIDIVSRWIKSSKTIEQFNEQILYHLKLSETDYDLLSSDIKQIFST